jgi:hypothetical protein
VKVLDPKFLMNASVPKDAWFAGGIYNPRPVVDGVTSMIRAAYTPVVFDDTGHNKYVFVVNDKLR